MKGKRQLTSIFLAVLLFLSILPQNVFAQAERVLEDESIYDLLVDRYYNGERMNDIDVDTQNLARFNGGDFVGISNRIQHLLDMNFTMISVGSVFASDTYDGKQVTSYDEIEPHFGTSEQFIALIDELHKEKLSIIADFPLSGLSKQHEWLSTQHAKAMSSTEETVSWDLEDEKTQQLVKQTLVKFIETYELDGIRLVGIEHASTAYVNELIEAVKEVRPSTYVISNVPSSAKFDTMPNLEKMKTLQQAFVGIDPKGTYLDLFKDENVSELLQVDELIGPRFTYEMIENRQFPPTRWKLALTALFTLPGVPIVPYATEIAVNGKEAPESHPLYNFKTDVELQERIGDLNILRNSSDALRNGDFTILYDEDGFFVYKRSTDEETWIVAINNRSETATIEIPASEIGENKRLRGVLEQDLVKEADDNIFRVVLERETSEIYIADEEKGFNTPYLIASILVYVLFLSFLFIVWKKGRQRRKEQDALDQ